MNRKLRANLMLLLTALVWGGGFAAQDMAMTYMPPFSFNGMRMLLAGLALLPVLYVQERKAARVGNTPSQGAAGKKGKALWIAGFWCGLMLFLGSGFQQMGIVHASAGKAGFVTALYIVLVPLMGLFGGKRVRRMVWLAVAICTAGLFFLCVNESLEIGPGDAYLLVCAFCYTGHILVIDHYSQSVNGLRMSCIQFFVCAALSLATAVLSEQPTGEGVRQSLLPILYAGLVSGAAGYTLQILAQRDTEPTIASLILCLESVFAVLAGWLLLGDLLTARELMGCGMMFAGILLAQWPEKRPEA